jgi:List-Bact-rpt repeat protein
MRHRFTLLILSLALSACKHPLEIVGEGDIVSASGTRDCLLEEYQANAPNCIENTVVNDAFTETYTAIPRPGWEFQGWSGYCTDTDEPSCSFAVPENWVAASAGLTVPALVANFRKPLTQSHNAVLMGHSFFQPMARDFSAYVQGAGFSDHEDVGYYAGGAGGAPISFWESGQSDAIKSSLDAGDISLLGLTFYPLEDGQRNLQGYINWIDYAIESNPGIEVFVGLPWSTNPGSVTPAVYDANWEDAHNGGFHQVIDLLRERYPSINIYCIPYGRASVELLHRYTDNQLPELTSLVSEDGGLYSDDFGHAGSMIVELASLVWIEAIYGVDISEYQYYSRYTTDLRPIAESIMAGHDRDYNR